MHSIQTSEKLTNYMNDQIRILVRQAWRGTRYQIFLLKTLINQRRAAKIRLQNEKRGRHIPPFLIASITSRCNLFCKGCYARANLICGENRPDSQMSPVRWGEIFQESKQLGISFILLAGGEPLLSRPVLEQAAQYPQIVFPVFTNGVLLDDAYASFFHRHRNLIPVLSLEGDASATDTRRGAGTYAMIERAMQRLAQQRIFYGVSVTLTRHNLADICSDAFCADLIRQGCRLLFFIEYVPVGNDHDQLAPGADERVVFEQRLLQLRSKFPDMLMISFPGDEKLTGGCVAAGRGFFHINSDGGAEPCPFSPFSDTSVLKGSLLEALDSPLFRKLDQAGLLLGEHTGGCHLFEHEEEVKVLLSNK